MNSPAAPLSSTPNPPAVLSAAQRHDLARQFEQAKQLAAKTPPDYRAVHRILSACCTLDPGNTLFLAALLKNLKSAEGKIASAWWWQVRAKQTEFTTAIAGQKWGEALASGWWLIGERPNGVDTYLRLAEVCERLDHRPTQIQLLTAAHERAPQDFLISDALATALAASGRFAESAALWRKRLEFSSQAAETPRRFLAALGGTALPPLNSSEALSLKARIDKLLQANQWDAAEQLLSDQGGAAGADMELRTLGEEITLARARGRTSIAEQLVKLEPAQPAFQHLVAELLNEQRRIELGVAYARYERFPSEPATSLELAGCLTRAKNFSEALKYLVPLQTNPAWRTRAWLATAENWQHLRQFERALAAYRAALDGDGCAAGDELIQQGWRRGAILAEAMGQPAVALAWQERLVAANPGDKDAAARLDNLRAICHKGGFSAGPEPP